MLLGGLEKRVSSTWLVTILEGEYAAKYIPLVGDMRKLKRFVNAVLMMQIEKTDLARTDFHRRDLINLMLLHWNYPGIFRRIYLEETEGRSGIYSIKTTADTRSREYVNAEGYDDYVDSCPERSSFLLNQLFGMKSLELGAYECVPLLFTSKCVIVIVLYLVVSQEEHLVRATLSLG
jgi:hypothetical protein